MTHCVVTQETPNNWFNTLRANDNGPGGGYGWKNIRANRATRDGIFNAGRWMP